MWRVCAQLKWTGDEGHFSGGRRTMRSGYQQSHQKECYTHLVRSLPSKSLKKLRHSRSDCGSGIVTGKVRSYGEWGGV